MQKINFLLILIFSTSCAYIPFFNIGQQSKDSIKFKGYKKLTSADYVDHLQSLKYPYLNSKDISTVKFNYKQKVYLKNTVNKIIKNNELFFKVAREPNVFVINDNTPFHFSLPGLNIFISSGLLKKYIKSEKTLYCLLAYELIISEKNIYKKRMIVPTGAIDTSRVLSLLRLGIDEKVEIHKWAFYILKRIGVDSDSYLSWLQIQNRNSVDFSLQLGDIGSISREESLFKAFIIKNTDKKKIEKKYEGSSKAFYSFVKSIKR